MELAEVIARTRQQVTHQDWRACYTSLLPEHATILLDAAERAADLERLVWAMANISHHWWDSISEPRIRSGRFCFRSPNLVLRFDLVNGLPQMTHELRVAIDATPGSPFHKADAARGESQ